MKKDNKKKSCFPHLWFQATKRLQYTSVSYLFYIKTKLNDGSTDVRANSSSVGGDESKPAYLGTCSILQQP